MDEENNSALAIVPDNQLSLAIGKRGQNARLAVRLTNWKIDIKSLSEAMSEGIEVNEAQPEVLIDEFETFEPIEEEVIVEEETIVEVEEPIIEEVEETPVVVEEETIVEVEETPIVEEEAKVEVKPMPIYEEDEEEYEYDDDDLSKYDEEIDYDMYDEYYDNH